jgi:hypothetical protein
MVIPPGMTVGKRMLRFVTAFHIRKYELRNLFTEQIGGARRWV